MITNILTRFYGNDKQTLGSLVVPKKDLFICKTLELAWKDNKNNISCIPADTYLCKYTRSNRLSNESIARWLKKNLALKISHCPDEIKNIFTYEILNVKNRAGIRIHSANYFYQLLGCIALGNVHKKLDADDQLDILHSSKTIEKFVALMNKEDFLLKIENNF